MTEHTERSDPVQGYQDVTTEQLDARHAKCSEYRCEGQNRARERRLAAKASESTGQLSQDVTERLGAVTAALESVGESLREATAWTQRVHLGIHEEPLAEWERELLAAVALERDAPRGTTARAEQAERAQWEREAAERELRTAERVRRIHTDEVQRQAAESLQAGLQHQRIVGTFEL